MPFGCNAVREVGMSSCGDETLRVTTTISDHLFVVLVEGSLAGDEADELGRMCRSLSGRTQADLSGLRWADARGVQMIRTLVAEGVELVKVPPFIALLLDASKSEGEG